MKMNSKNILKQNRLILLDDKIDYTYEINDLINRISYDVYGKEEFDIKIKKYNKIINEFKKVKISLANYYYKRKILLVTPEIKTLKRNTILPFGIVFYDNYSDEDDILYVKEKTIRKDKMIKLDNNNIVKIKEEKSRKIKLVNEKIIKEI